MLCFKIFKYIFSFCSTARALLLSLNDTCDKRNSCRHIDAWRHPWNRPLGLNDGMYRTPNDSVNSVCVKGWVQEHTHPATHATCKIQDIYKKKLYTWYKMIRIQDLERWMVYIMVKYCVCKPNLNQSKSS